MQYVYCTIDRLLQSNRVFVSQLQEFQCLTLVPS